MSDIVNPYIAGSPVTGPEMFFGREDVFAFIRQTLIGQHRDNVIVLYGQRRTGKTSVLYQMHSYLDTRYLCIFMDLHGFAIENLGGFLWELANHIVRILRRDYQIDLPRLNRAEFMADPRSYFENEFLNQVWSVIGDHHVLLMMDEAIRLEEQVQAGNLDKEIFEYMRHLMQHHERLNFLFSLGSGLEEMKKEYAFLFSVGLYKKISFLDSKTTSALITEPVKDHYQVEPATLERIYQITSGHPYYTQLLCHSLFNRWQQRRVSPITIRDVEEVLDEVVERGLAVLKHVWEESTAGEKAVMAGIAAAVSRRNHFVGAKAINQVWKRCDVTIPQSEVAKGLKGLIARDVIAGQDKYGFTVDLQRLWVQKYRRLEWVKEEITDAVQEWSSKSITSRRRISRRTVLGGLGGLTVLAIGGGVGLLWWEWSRPNYTPLIKYTGHSNQVWGVAWSPDGTRIASCGADRTVQVWNASSGQPIHIDRGHTEAVVRVTWSPDSKRIASASVDKTVHVSIANKEGLIIEYRGHSDRVLAVAWSPDGKRIASSSVDKTVQVWDANNGDHSYTYKGHSKSIPGVTWSPDSKHIASASEDQTVQVWDADTGKLVTTYKKHIDTLESVAWSPNGTLIASAGYDKTVQVWHATTGYNIYTYRGHSDAVLSVTWSPDSKRIASASKDQTVHVWDAGDGGHLYSYHGHSSIVFGVTWSPDGKRIASASADKTVLVWLDK